MLKPVNFMPGASRIGLITKSRIIPAFPHKNEAINACESLFIVDAIKDSLLFICQNPIGVCVDYDRGIDIVRFAFGCQKTPIQP